jgi:DHA1 family tetracycline resistance protein-like MFS transporter
MAAESLRPRKAAFVFVFVTVMLDMLALGIIIPVLPHLVESFVAGDAARAAKYVGLFGTVWAAIQFFSSPVAGALSDHFGRRPVILFSNLGLGLDYVLMALAPSLSWLFLGRVISGITSASIATAGAYIADVSAPEDRAKRFGMLGAAFGIGFVLGPAVGGLLGAYDLRAPFWAAAAMSLANFLYGFFILPESLKPENHAPFELRKANPLGSLQLLSRHRELWGLASISFLSQLAHTSLAAIFVLYAGYRYHWGPNEVGMMLAGVGIATMIVQGGLVRPIVKAVGERQALVLGLASGAAGLTWYGLATTGAMAAGGVVIAAFWGLYGAAAQSIMSQRVGASEQGKLQGASTSVAALANIVGPSFFAYVFATAVDPRLGLMMPGLGFLVAGGLLLLALVLAILLTRRAVVPQRV